MIRVVVYNVSGGIHLEAAGDVIASLEPSVVCVLERPSARRLVRLAHRSGLEVAVRAGRRGSGTAILVDPDVQVGSVSTLPLTTPTDGPRREVAQVLLRVGGLGLSVAAFQQGLDPHIQRIDLDELLRFLGSIDAATVLGCDLDAPAHSPAAMALAERFQDAYAVAGTGSGETHPSGDPRTRRGFVFVDRELTILGAFVASAPPVETASHHRPVVVDLAGREDDATRLPIERDDTPERRIA